MTATAADRFARDGYALVPGVLGAAECAELTARIGPLAVTAAGTRHLLAAPWCRDLAAGIARHAELAPLLTGALHAVQCTYFEKSAARNWLVAPHQDLSIPVAARTSDPACSGWSEKEGTTYVQPPLDVLQAIVAVRLHLDDCAADDGPLQVAPGTHRLGRLAAAAAVEMMTPSIACVGVAGTAVVMRPLLVHASSKATGSSRRRVLHFVFGPRDLPCGLRWPSE